MRYHVTIGDRVYAVDLEEGRVSVDGEDLQAALTVLSGTSVASLRVGAAHRRLVVGEPEGDRRCLQVRGRAADVEVLDERTRRIREMSGTAAGGGRSASIRAPMPGLVVKVAVDEGETVRRGQGVVIVEAMKMENELAADAPSRVARIHVAAGDTVEKGQVLVELEPCEVAGGADHA